MTKRGQKIEALEFGPAGDGDSGAPDRIAVKDGTAVGSKSGQLRLRVVEGDDS